VVSHPSIITDQLPKGLRFFGGHNYEEVIWRLEVAKIPFDTWWTTGYASSNFFRNSTFRVLGDYEREVRNLLGVPNRSMRGFDYFYGEYVIGEDFDLSLLNGKITFNQGNLVEIVSVYCER
jgi:hypothetical protein